MTCQTLPNIVQASSYMKPKFRTRKPLKYLHDHLDKQPSKKPVWVSVCHPRSSLDFYYQDLPCTEDITGSPNFIPSPAIMRSEGVSVSAISIVRSFELLYPTTSQANDTLHFPFPYFIPWQLNFGTNAKWSASYQRTLFNFHTRFGGCNTSQLPAEQHLHCDVVYSRVGEYWIWIGRMTSRNFIGHS